MINKLLIFFIVLPMVELVLLTILSHYTSITTTILFIIGTGILGTWLAHSQGWSTYRRIQQELAQGRMPTDSLIDGVLILIAGILLISPGVLTDVAGIVLMLPPSRVFFRRRLVAWFKRNFHVQTFVPTSQPIDRDVVDSYATQNSDSKSRTTFDSHSPRLNSRE